MTVFPLGRYGDDDHCVNKVHGRISEMAGNAVGTEYRVGRRVTKYVVKRWMRQQYMRYGDAMVWLLMSTTIHMVLTDVYHKHSCMGYSGFLLRTMWLRKWCFLSAFILVTQRIRPHGNDSTDNDYWWWCQLTLAVHRGITNVPLVNYCPNLGYH